MFVNSEDNQYTGLVPRSQSWLGPKQTSTAMPTPINSWTHSHDPHSTDWESLHHPTVQEEDNLPVDTTPLLMRCLQRLLSAARVAQSEGHINRHQCGLAVRRLRLISETLRRMPQPAPSMRLLTAMQSLCLLLRQCAHSGRAVTSMAEWATALQVMYGHDGNPLGPAQCWPVLLCQHFTCRRLFQAAYRRLWAAWSMYSRTELEREDAIAEAQDLTEDVQAVAKLLAPHGDLCEQDNQATPDEANSAVRHRRDMIAYYQRRELSPWRVLYDDLARTDEPLARLSRLQDAPKSVIASTGQRGGEQMSLRFRVLPQVYRYNGVPVVVKALSGALDTNAAEIQAGAMWYASDFILDVGCRATWCHTNIVKCIGGYAEKFAPDTECTKKSVAHSEALVADEYHTEAMTENSSMNHRETLELPGSISMGSLPWQRAEATATGKPIMTLGYVMELQGALQATTAPASQLPPGLTLSDLLCLNHPPSAAASASSPTVNRHHFSLHEALNICSQIADALHYIMEDAYEVSEAVRTAWLTVDPANIFVVRVVELDENSEPLYEEQLQQDGVTGSGYQQARRATSPVSSDTGSHVFTDSAPPTSGRCGDLKAPLVGVSDSPNAQEMTAHIIRGVKTSYNQSETALHRRSKHFVVRYNPPCGWTLENAGGSRWRPHVRATAPSSYVVVQLFLALLTGQVPYAHMKTDSEVEEQVFVCAKQQHNNASDTALRGFGAASTVQVKASNSGQGYRIPLSLPPIVVNWCRRGLSLDHTQPPMELEALRGTLTMIQASLSDEARHSRIHMGMSFSTQGHDAGRGTESSHPDMQSSASVSGLSVFCG